MADLFDTRPSSDPQPTPAVRPLADRIRPVRMDDVIGQEKVLGPDGPLGSMLAAGSLSSLILWGPPGVGKTTIARLLADETDLAFVQISAIFTGVPELRKVFEAAKLRRQQGRGTLLFVDEIHRFNKAQQDGFLPHMEDGTILLVGATTENPSFELNAALLSRAQVVVLDRLGPDDLERLAQRAETELGRKLPLTAQARDAMLDMADGDGRAALNLVEQVAAWKTDKPVGPDALSQRLMKRAAKYDKSGDEHYNLISAIPTRRCIGWRGCWKGARIPVISHVVSPAWRSRISAWPIPLRRVTVLTPGPCMNAWAVPRANWHWGRR
jgi:putative ATPase